jgi:hypothetical protein
MLNAGIGTLTYLKSRILPAAQAVEATWDAPLAALGLALAGRMQAHCNRLFYRAVGAVEEFGARTLAVTLRRYPVETITTVQVRDTAGTLCAATDYGIDKEAGLLSFQTVPGDSAERLVITYTGGYWLDPRSLPATAMPTGATALPYDLLELWLAEVQAHAEMRGTFEAVGLRTQKDKDKAKLINGLTEAAVEGLRPYRRFSGE